METKERSAVAERAYEIWEREGRPAGREMDHWLQAERELATEGGAARPASPAGRKPARSSSAPKPKVTRSRTPRKQTAGSGKTGPGKS